MDDTLNVKALPDLRAPLLAGIAVLAALALPSAGAWLLDARELRGVNVWDKPLKFQFSLGLHLATLLVAVRLLDPAASGRTARRAHAAVLAVSVCCVLEALYIALQAARGRESHFNRDTALEAALYYGGMGTAALVILAGTALVGALLGRQARQPDASGLAYGMALGLLAGSAATLVAVVPLSSGMVDGLGHWVGGVRSDAGGLPLLGWSTTGGDLRVPHFFATHLMQAVPLAGWLADRLAPGRARRWCLAVTATGLLGVVATLLQALAGQPFHAP
jgi:hypothetical protein